MTKGWLVYALCGLALLVVAIGSTYGIGIHPQQLAELRGLSAYLGEYRHLDWSDAKTHLALLAETLIMAMWGTLLATLIALPLSAFSARAAGMPKWAIWLAREYMTAARSIPDAILALMFVTAFGLGPVPGVLALGIHSSGFLSKVLTDSMDRLPVTIEEGLLSTGSSRFQIVRFGLWPSIDREIVGYVLYLLDRNTRVAATLGFVGAGGIGMALKSALSQFEEPVAGTIILMLVGLMLLIEGLSTHFREILSR